MPFGLGKIKITLIKTLLEHVLQNLKKDPMLFLL